MKKSLRFSLLAVPALALVLSGCSTTAAPGASGSPSADTVSIVASTNVYGSIAEAVAGGHGQVTSLVTSAAQDPHSYEANAQDTLAISKADLVIKNGGGYDSFIDSLLSAAKGEAPVVLNASEASGLMPGHEAHDHSAEEPATEDAHDHAAEEEGHEGHNHIEGFNEHVWYSLEGMKAVSHDLAHELGDLRPEFAADFHKNYEDFNAKIDALLAEADALHAQTAGKNAAITEPVPLYLLEAVGLKNVTPEAFSEAIEEGTDVSPATMAETLSIMGDGSLALLAYNEQTSGSETEKVRSAAETAGVPIVNFTETLPENKDYVSWMQENLDNITKALGK